MSDSLVPAFPAVGYLWNDEVGNSTHGFEANDHDGYEGIGGDGYTIGRSLDSAVPSYHTLSHVKFRACDPRSFVPTSWQVRFAIPNGDSTYPRLRSADRGLSVWSTYSSCAGRHPDLSDEDMLKRSNAFKTRIVSPVHIREIKITVKGTMIACVLCDTGVERYSCTFGVDALDLPHTLRFWFDGDTNTWRFEEWTQNTSASTYIGKQPVGLHPTEQWKESHTQIPIRQESLHESPLVNIDPSYIDADIQLIMYPPSYAVIQDVQPS